MNALSTKYFPNKILYLHEYKMPRPIIFQVMN